MNLKEIHDSACTFSNVCKDIEVFFLKDLKHIRYFVQEAQEVKYVMMCRDGIVVGYTQDTQKECMIPWEDFLHYIYKVLLKY